MWICWRIFFIEYLAYYGSIEPLFFALARHIRDHWPHLGWWRYWYCGMPFEYTYQPLLHYVVAILSACSGWDVARAFHVAIGLGYSLGPVSLYFLSLRLSRRTDIAAVAALLYSLWSPSAALMPAVAADVGGLWNARRLQTTVVYADGPHMAGLTLLPLAILLIDWAIARRGAWAFIVSSLVLMAVMLTNIPATISLAMALAALVLTSRRFRVRTGFSIAGMLLFGYSLACFWMPWSALWQTFTNAQRMAASVSLGPKNSAFWVPAIVVIALTLAVAWLAERLRWPRYASFAAVFAVITAQVVLGAAWLHIDLIPQAARFHLVMEMAIAMLVAACLVPLFALYPTTRWIGVGVALMFCVIQVFHYRAFARHLIQAADLSTRSEYRIARWFDEHAGGARVLVPGSVAFWLNSLTDTPQMKGCCDQNELFAAPRIAYYEFGGDFGVNEGHAAEVSLAWLRTLGIRYVAMCGPGSTEAYHDIVHPSKFDGVLPLRWREGGDSIFEIPVRANSLAHAIPPAARIARMPENGLDIAPLLPYVAAIENPSCPRTEFRWATMTTAEIRGFVPEGHLVSVQIPYHPGWQASSLGHPIPVSKDALGMMILAPNCNGLCSISLEFSGGREAVIQKLISFAAWTTAVLAIFVGIIRDRPQKRGLICPDSPIIPKIGGGGTRL